MPPGLEERLAIATEKIADGMQTISRNTTALERSVVELNEKFILHDARTAGMEESLKDVIYPLVRWFALALIAIAGAWVGFQVVGV